MGHTAQITDSVKYKDGKTTDYASKRNIFRSIVRLEPHTH